MNPTLNKILENLNQYNSYITKNEFYPIQKAYTTPHFLVLIVRVPQKSLCIYIGRGNQYLGIYVHDKPPPAFLRIQDKFLDYIRSHIVGAKASKIEILVEPKNELIQFRFKTNVDNNWLILGYHNRELFFAKQEADLIFESWTNQIGERATVAWPESDWTKFILNQKIDIAKYIETEEKKSIGVVELKKREKFLLKKIRNINLDLIACENGKVIEEKLLQNELDLSQSEIIICGQRFSFIGLKNEWEKKDYIFKKIKKLKRGKLLLAERLSEAEAELVKVERGELKRSTTKEKAIQVLWKKVEKNTKSTSNINHGDFIHIEIGGVSGLIGLNSSGNDTMRGLSHKEHFWFHIENYPGAHCILKTENISLLSMEQIEMIGSILRDYSKLEIMEIPLLFTQVKNIKGVKGAKGKVIVSKAKHLRCLYKNWKEIISIV